MVIEIALKRAHDIGIEARCQVAGGGFPFGSIHAGDKSRDTGQCLTRGQEDSESLPNACSPDMVWIR
jgi:hypothetical protein